MEHTLQEWLIEHDIDATIEGAFLKANDEMLYLIIDPKPIMYNELGELLLTEGELHTIESNPIVGLVIYLGSMWYLSPTPSITDIELLSNIGKTDDDDIILSTLIGIHGGYELCNAIGTYERWCERAKFLGYKNLVICEENTLAGVMAFQNACQKAKIVPIIGESITITQYGIDDYTIKLVVENEVGWRNLLQINALINTATIRKISNVDFLKQSTEGLKVIVMCDCPLIYTEQYNGAYYGFTFTQWDSPQRDSFYLQNIQDYITAYFLKTTSLIPIFAPDAYYIYPSEASIRKDLNLIGKVPFHFQSKDLYIKRSINYVDQASKLFPDSIELLSLLSTSVDNANNLIQGEPFTLKQSLRLPRFLDDREEAKSLFYSLIDEGVITKILPHHSDEDCIVYFDRIEKEIKVIEKGGFIDYFLIIWDIIAFCRRSGIWVGTGRGSAAGCLVSYLIGIVSIDPIKYNLLFERFLNESRITKGLPDIDIDFQGSRREEVKSYMEEKYGHDYVTSIGTFGTFKIKAAIQALGRRNGADLATTNYMTGAIENDDMSIPELLKLSLTTPVIFNYIQTHPQVIEKIPSIINQPNNSSIHAAGVVIVPKENGTIYQQMPVKSIEGTLVSEWEGEYIDQIGFLKCDILGLKQLDKFAEITTLIEQTTGRKITYEDINLDDSVVFGYFCKGYNQDIFQFGGRGLKGYCQSLLPSSIEDLIATVALYRPGPINMGAHDQYVRLKAGTAILEYDYGLQDVTKNTYGLFVYQEQIMSAVQTLGGFTLVEADDIRKAIGKKLPELMASYRQKFIDEAIQRGASVMQADSIWQKMEGFGGYAFNRSHAACYAIMGYYSQWFKVNYPLHFWTTSLKYAKDNDQVMERVMEIFATSSIQLSPVDINESGFNYEANFEHSAIYWSLISVYGVGDVAVKDILTERNRAGKFFSFEEFVARTKPYRGINRTTYINLIFSGAFDQIEDLSEARQRYMLLEKYDSEYAFEYMRWPDYRWLIKQKELCGFAYIDFKELLSKTGFNSSQKRRYQSIPELLQDDEKDNALICAMVSSIEKKTSKKGTDYASMILNDGQAILQATLWSDCLEKFPDILTATDKIIGITGKIAYDARFKKANTFQSTHSTVVYILN